MKDESLPHLAEFSGFKAGTRGSSIWRRVVGWLLIGAAIRLLLLPLALHPDLLAVYSRVMLWNQGEIELHDFNLQALPMLLHGWSNSLLGTDLPDMSGLPWPMLLDQVQARMCEILAEPASLSRVFAWKLPYLLADLGCGLLAARLVGPTRFVSTLRLWMLHPVAIYVICLVGKYESFMLIPLFLGLLDLRANRSHRGFVWIGLAVAMRIYPIILVFPLALVASPSSRRRLEFITLAGVPQILVLAACALRSHLAWVLLPITAFAIWKCYCRVRTTAWEIVLWALVLGVLGTLVGPAMVVLQNPHYSAAPLLQHGQFLAQSRIAFSQNDTILLLGLAYGCVLVWAHRVGASRHPGTSMPFDDALDACLLACTAFYAFSFFNPQYSLMLIAIVVIGIHRLKEARAAYGLQLLGLFLFLFFFGNGALSIVYLFVPMSPNEILDLPGPLENLPAQIAEQEWATYGRTLLVLGCGWMALEVLLSRRRVATTRLIPARSSMQLAGLLVWPIGLSAALGISMWTDRTRAETFTRMAELYAPQQPFDGVEFDTYSGLPAALEVRTKRYGGMPLTEQHLIELLPPEGAEETEPLGTLRISPAQLKMDKLGRIRLPLDELPLEAGRSYRLAWRSGGFTPRPLETEMRTLRALAPGEAIADILAGLWRRMSGAMWFTISWLGSVLVCIAIGLILLLGQRTTARHTALVISPAKKPDLSLRREMVSSPE